VFLLEVLAFLETALEGVAGVDLATTFTVFIFGATALVALGAVLTTALTALAFGAALMVFFAFVLIFFVFMII